jgi:superfamily II DNA/RNA helicase
VHSGEISDAENERRLKLFHERAYDVLIQVRKASEGFDAPPVSVLLKLDAVFSREPVIQQLGRGLRYNHALPREQNLLNVFIGRDPRLSSIIEHLEREQPLGAIQAAGEADASDSEQPREDEEELDAAVDAEAAEVIGVEEAGDAYLDHTGQLVDGQQLTMFGVRAPAPVAAVAASTATVVDAAALMQEAIDYCKTWTNRAAAARAKKVHSRENHHAALNLAYSKHLGVRGALSTPEAYRAKGDWMKRRYAEFIG